MTIAARLLAILEAQTGQFDARMAASAVVLDKMTSSQVIARRAAGQLRGALQGVAMQALGMVGPAGQAGTALLSLAGGMSAVLTAGAAGGLALLMLNDAKVLAQFTQEANAAAAAARGLAATRIGSPVLQRMAATEGLQASRDELEDKIRNLASNLRFVPGFEDATLAQLGEWDATLGEMIRKLAGLNKQMSETLRQPETVLIGMRRQLQLINIPLEESLRLQAEWAGLVGATADEFVRLGLELQKFTLVQLAFERQFPILEGRAAMGALRGGEGAGFPFAKGVTGEKFAPREFFLQDLVKEGGKTRPPGLDASMIAAQSLQLMGAVKQGGPGGILSAGGGLATTLGAGAIFAPLGAALGGAFDLFDRSEERRHRELVSSIERLGKEVGLEHVTVVFTGPDGHQVRKSLADLESGDAVERVPGPVGAGG